MEVKNILSKLTIETLDFLKDLPNPLYRPLKGIPLEYQHLVKELILNGIIVIPSYFAKETMEPIAKEAVEAFTNPQLSKTITVGGKPYNTLINKPFHSVTGLVPLVKDPLIVAFVRGYFRRPDILLAEASLEHLPAVNTDEGSYKWHYDLRGKQLKCMILLSDVPPDGQHFSFVKGTHVHRPIISRKDGRISDSEMECYDNSLYTHGIGPMGSIVIFDTRGIHKGTRRNTHVRNNLTLNFKLGSRFLYPVDFPKNIVKDFNKDELKILRCQSTRV